MYFVKLGDGSEIAVRLDESNRGRWVATTPDGESVSLEIKGRGQDGTFVLLVDGEQRSFSITEASEGFTLREGDQGADVQVSHAADLLLGRLAGSQEKGAEAETLTSPITGIVISVPVERGAAVTEGQTVIIVEAMKMENSLGAPRAGSVVEIFAEPGQTVFVGDPLVRIQ